MPDSDVQVDLSSAKMAAAFNRVEMVVWLLTHGASADARDATGLRAIDIARAMAANDVVAMLPT